MDSVPIPEARTHVPPVRALERGIRLLQSFAPTCTRMTLTELAAAGGIDKATARRMLHTLLALGLVEYEEHSRCYLLGAGVLELAAAVETGRDLCDVALPHMAELAERARVNVFLWVHHEGEAMCAARVRTRHPTAEATWFSVGLRTTLNCGASPRVILAFLSSDDRAEALSRPLLARTAFSDTDPASLHQAAQEIRARGWELAIDDFALGFAATAAPILDRNRRLLGSLSITTVTAELVHAGESRHLQALLRTARAIGQAMR